MEACQKKNDTKIKHLEERLLHIESFEVENLDAKDKVACSRCDFTGTSKHGLKVHIAKKHSTILVKNKTINCQLCSETVKTEKELRKHMKIHSFKRANYKCEECNFLGENEETMKVHIGRKHSDHFECGLCEIEAKTSENLETHLRTCEKYLCKSCDQSEATLKKFKEHMQNTHMPREYDQLTHLKLDRRNSDEISCKNYFWKDV